jgi:hypothetical protein
MSTIDRLRAAWACEECRFYRRAGVVLAVLAGVVWMLT